eukprot:TRINITY_DN18371_c0_g3_i1.p1 TRINITY_DN18371_c0_g3~~TRINITY_DN18371_c0_g3_i1.p1  ORF type:complete len:268 (-),score=34.28 TRINITY_DN18371_c0_g3_i1:70-777(-)
MFVTSSFLQFQALSWVAQVRRTFCVKSCRMAHVLVGACVFLSAHGAEAVGLRGRSLVDAISQTIQKLSLDSVADDTGFFDNATAFLDQLKDKEATESALKRSLLDPQPAVGFFSCVRDTTGCPLGFVEGGEDVQVCVPKSSYRGSCSTPIDFSAMSILAKTRWADACQAPWPCSDCARDYSGCPADWKRSGGADALSCEPPASYVGGCDAADFSAASVADLESWASSCGTVWPCK